MKRAGKHLSLVIEERLRNEAQYGQDWAEKPVRILIHKQERYTDVDPYQNDLLSWLIDEAPEDRKTVHDLALRILVVNFAAIHTSSLVRLFVLSLFKVFAHNIVPLGIYTRAVFSGNES